MPAGILGESKLIIGTISSWSKEELGTYHYHGKPCSHLHTGPPVLFIPHMFYGVRSKDNSVKLNSGLSGPEGIILIRVD